MKESTKFSSWDVSTRKGIPEIISADFSTRRPQIVYEPYMTNIRNKFQIAFTVIPGLKPSWYWNKAANEIVAFSPTERGWSSLCVMFCFAPRKHGWLLRWIASVAQLVGILSFSVALVRKKTHRQFQRLLHHSTISMQTWACWVLHAIAIITAFPLMLSVLFVVSGKAFAKSLARRSSWMRLDYLKMTVWFMLYMLASWITQPIVLLVWWYPARAVNHATEALALAFSKLWASRPAKRDKRDRKTRKAENIMKLWYEAFPFVTFKIVGPKDFMRITSGHLNRRPCVLVVNTVSSSESFDQKL